MVQTVFEQFLNSRLMLKNITMAYVNTELLNFAIGFDTEN